MIEEIFFQYGAIGACLLGMSTFFYRYYKDNSKFQEKFLTIVDNNTVAMTKVYEIVAHCPKIKRKV